MIFTIRAFVTFFTIIDPVGLAPVVIALTAHLNDAQRNTIITRAIVISAAIIAFFALVGRFLLDRLGISLYAFNMAGGVLLFLVAVDMLFGRSPGTRETKTEEEQHVDHHACWSNRHSSPLTHSRHPAGRPRHSVCARWYCHIYTRQWSSQRR